MKWLRKILITLSISPLSCKITWEAIGYNRKNLKLMLPDDLFFTTLKGVVFGDMQHTTNPVKLTLRYKVYNY